MGTFCVLVNLLTVHRGQAQVVFNPPRGDAPRETRGGASRSNDACLQSQSETRLNFTSLLPSSNYGLTLAEHPTLWVYVPPSSAQEMLLNLTDTTGQVYYQSRFLVPPEGGIFGLSVPDEIPAMEIGQLYHWGVAVLCSGQLRPDSPFIEGWIRRTTLSTELNDQLGIVSPLERAMIYGEQGLWYDTLSTLVELRQQRATDSLSIVDSSWENLLHSANLSGFAAEPVRLLP